jgi:cation diffusion facilitator CzcD-associated flavoprotein CzcO
MFHEPEISSLSNRNLRLSMELLPFQFSFHLSPNWLGWLASADEILNYLKEVARFYKVERDIRYIAGALVGSRPKHSDG